MWVIVVTHWSNIEFLEACFSEVLGLEFGCLEEVAVVCVLVWKTEPV